MCGIFGIKYVDQNRTVPLDLVKRATDLMAHRGPDDAGYWVHGSVGLGHRRLSIIDLSPLGHQPMFNEDETVGLTFNGEIYNYAELYQPLCDRGHAFRSRSDTEVIIHAYEEWGHGCLGSFNGMFAFGVWDERSQSLWVVRDRLGIKPLYYFWDGSVFIFSSEIKPILESGHAKPQLNESVLDAYFSLGYVPGPETMFKQIHKVRPGHFLCLCAGQLTEKMYWDFAHVPESTRSYAELQEQMESLLEDSIRLRMRSDVPVGVFLSGGLDSSAIVALMSKQVKGPINTFTVGFSDIQDYSEEKYAGSIAQLFATKHHVFNLDPGKFFDSLEQLVTFAEEPIVEPAAIALYHISTRARPNATVLLSGEGSDELFAGYYLYDLMNKIDRVYNFVPQFMSRMVLIAAHALGKRKYTKYADWLCQPLTARYQGTSSYLTESIKQDLYSRQFYLQKGDYLEQVFAKYFENVKDRSDSLAKMLYVDAKTWLVDDLLVKADKMTMAASIELREPFLDYRLVEFASSLPSRFKLDSGTGKVILKSIMKDKLPQEIITRKKMGFPVPVHNWFRNELFEEIQSYILNSFVVDYISKDTIHTLLNNHKNNAEDNSTTIMSLLVIAKWHERYIKQGI